MYLDQMNNSRRRIDTMVQWVYVTTLCYLLFILSASSSRQCTATQIVEERSPLYESRLNYHAKVSEIDQGQTAHLFSHPSAVYPNRKLILSPSHDEFVEEHQAQQQELAETSNRGQKERPKSYAFAYAVRDGDRGADLSTHKERREGKVTIGEYSTLLPDGRTQVVRYTSDSKRGFKADVTYEGEEKGKETYQTSAPPQHLYLHSSSANAPAVRPQVYNVGGDSKVYRKYNPTPTAYKPLLQSSPSPSPKTTGPIFLSYPLKAQRPSLPPSIIYQSGGESYRQQPERERDLVAATPSPKLYTLQRGPTPSPYPPPTIYTKEGPTIPTYTTYKHSNPSPSAIPLKFYASTSPNSLYGNSGRPVKFSSKLSRNPSPAKHSPSVPTIAFRPVPSKSYPNNVGGGVVPEGPTSPYRPIPRGQRAGPDPTVPVYVSQSGPLYINSQNRGSYASPSEDKFKQVSKDAPRQEVTFTSSSSQGQIPAKTGGIKNKSSLVPIEFFKAGPASKGPPAFLQEEQSVRQSYIQDAQVPIQLQSPRTTFSTPLEIQDSQTYFQVQEQQQQSQLGEEQIYYEQPSQLDQQQVQFTPVKSSVATYTKEYLGTPHPPVFESTSSPGIPVGRAVQPSVGGLVYIDVPNLSQRTVSQQEGIKEALSRLPNVSPIPGQTTNHPYEAGAPDFGNSVSYSPTSSSSSSSSDLDRGKLVEPDLSSNQLSHVRREDRLHQRDGIIREYLVEKKYDNLLGYESELA